jgi:hypothetical protein
VWAVNVEAEYHEEARAEAPTDRLVPRPARAADPFALLRTAFARYDQVALGAALGTVGGLGLFLATAVLLVRGGEPLGPNLSMLAQYLLGFEVSWGGALLGLVEAGALGFAVGWLLASSLNALIDAELRSLQRRLVLARALDPLEWTD